MTRPAIVRLTLAVSLILAVLLSTPTQRVVAGVNSARAGSTSSLGVDASLHLMSNGKIAFVGGFTDGSLDVVNPDGSGLRRLARCRTHRCVIIQAVWSSDARRIAFLRGMPTGPVYGRVSHLSLYVVNANGSGERRLAPCGRPVGCDWDSLAWSPNGTSLATTLRQSLYVLDLNTGRLRRLTIPVAAPVVCSHGCSGCYLICAGFDLAPAWSLDGSTIAFARGGCGGACDTWPFIVNADGTGLKRLSSLSPGYLLARPLWSPDGRAIAFTARHGIYAVNPDGSHLRLLVRAPPFVASNQLQELASWSPDGRLIVYIRTPWSWGRRGPQATALWIMNANGTGQRRLYRASHGNFGDATWSPDGQFIAFTVEVSRADDKVDASRSGLYVMGADGRHLHRLAAAGYDLAWQPIP